MIFISIKIFDLNIAVNMDDIYCVQLYELNFKTSFMQLFESNNISCNFQSILLLINLNETFD